LAPCAALDLLFTASHEKSSPNCFTVVVTFPFESIFLISTTGFLYWLLKMTWKSIVQPTRTFVNACCNSSIFPSPKIITIGSWYFATADPASAAAGFASASGGVTDEFPWLHEQTEMLSIGQSAPMMNSGSETNGARAVFPKRSWFART
jgi:hypothetical protein